MIERARAHATRLCTAAAMATATDLSPTTSPIMSSSASGKHHNDLGKSSKSNSSKSSKRARSSLLESSAAPAGAGGAEGEERRADGRSCSSRKRCGVGGNAVAHTTSVSEDEDWAPLPDLAAMFGAVDEGSAQRAHNGGGGGNATWGSEQGAAQVSGSASKSSKVRYVSRSGRGRESCARRTPSRHATSR
jgi:hypothetical protein